MASKARVRAELAFRSFPYNGSEGEKSQARDQAFRALLMKFRRMCQDYGVMRDYKAHEYFESEPRKDRRKRKESHLRRLQEVNRSNRERPKKTGD